MNPDARRKLEANIQGERDRDLDALMAPLSEVPCYVVPGWVLEGRAAVRTMYERAMPLLRPELSDEYLRALDDTSVAHWGDDHVVLERRSLEHGGFNAASLSDLRVADDGVWSDTAARTDARASLKDRAVFDHCIWRDLHIGVDE